MLRRPRRPRNAPANDGASSGDRLLGADAGRVLELTALPTIGAERWVPWVREADVLLVDGGDAQPSPEKCRKSGSAATRPRTDAGPHIG